MADQIYFLPVTPEYVEQVIKKEKPGGILLSFGGQTALNCGVELWRKGILQKHNVKVLGTQVESIIATEDRHDFVQKLGEIDVKTPRSRAVGSVREGLRAAAEIGYPVMLRAAFALGGRGSGRAENRKHLQFLLSKAFRHSGQVLIEEYLKGWKEVEYEVVRDSHDNCITVCNMENLDPLGIHTGESIVVAPSQTLTNSEYHALREISIRVIRHLRIVGECNIQYALDPKSWDYRVIEVNARLSRSSALASKATGYPLAFVAAKLALGKSLIGLRNSITQTTSACFEPALDYVVVKMPRWDLHKFRRVSRHIGTEMKSVGEVMAIDRTFEAALQKAIRMLQTGRYGLVCNRVESFRDKGAIIREIRQPTDERIFAIASALKNGMNVNEISELSEIDRWFLYKMKNIVQLEEELRRKHLDKDLLLRAKRAGFSDKQLSIIYNVTEEEMRNKRQHYRIIPCIKQIDTHAAEYPARTNYLYLTYQGTEDDVSFPKNKTNRMGKTSKMYKAGGQRMEGGRTVIVLGSGAYRIGSSVEFDWCCVSCVDELRALGYDTVMINYNPETVSTDYDMCSRLYFDELSLETVLDIYEKEMPLGIIVSMGGQIPNNLVVKLEKNNVNILGTTAEMIDTCEDRSKFSRLLDSLHIDQPEWQAATSMEDIDSFAAKVGYPLLVRPSYVLSGAAMRIAFRRGSLMQFLEKASDISEEYPVVVSRFINDARELEMDAVAADGSLVAWAVSEHIENAGVHSGDATMVLPPQRTYLETIRRIRRLSARIAKALRITGPFNIQFIAKENHVKVIECNLRASRSFPFVSKILKQNFIALATRAIMGKKPKPQNNSMFDLDYVGVKAPQFSFTRLVGADPALSVEMSSTGEVACFGDDLHEAFLKSTLATGFNIPKKNVLVSVGGEMNRFRILDSVRKLRQMGFGIYSTEHTTLFLRNNGIPCMRLYKVHETASPGIMDYIIRGKLDFVINVPSQYKDIELDDTYHIRRAAIDFSIPLLTNLQVANVFVSALYETFERRKKGTLSRKGREIKAWGEY